MRHFLAPPFQVDNQNNIVSFLSSAITHNVVAGGKKELNQMQATETFLIVFLGIGSLVLVLEVIAQALEKRQARKEAKSKITNYPFHGN